MKSYRASRSPCPINRAARLLGDRWVILILREAFLGADRFEQFIERMGINRAALTSRLDILIEAGLMVREPPTGKRARYVLTQRAYDLGPLYQEMADWGSDNLFDKDEPRGKWQQGELPKPAQAYQS